MTRRHEERYKRVLARLVFKPEKRDAVQAKVELAITKSNNKKLPANFAETYVNHKLGIRKEKKGQT